MHYAVVIIIIIITKFILCKFAEDANAHLVISCDLDHVMLKLGLQLPWQQSVLSECFLY